mgnify:CR=1 FL=1
MEFELWYLIAVPILFAAGWWLRGVDFKQRKKAAQGLDEHYAKGLSLLLSDDPVKTDKAIDLFIEAVRLDPETIELHHALGNLFRRRGQFDRAIRIHSFLVNRAELPAAERGTALAELALDYLKAGMYDRAEGAYEQLAGFKGREAEALDALMHIYCTEHEWMKAVETAERLQKSGKDLHVEISHYYCELANLARMTRDATRAGEFVNDALKANPANARALSLAADLAFDAGKTDEALKAWGEIEKVKPSYAPLIAAKKADVLAETDKTAAMNYLKDVFEKSGSIDVLQAAVARMSVWADAPAAAAFAGDALKKRPSLSAFAVLCNLRSKANPEDEQARLLAEVTTKQSKLFARYQCSHCGFLAHTFTWQCPGCERWDSFPPLRVDEAKKASYH